MDGLNIITPDFDEDPIVIPSVRDSPNETSTGPVFVCTVYNQYMPEISENPLRWGSITHYYLISPAPVRLKCPYLPPFSSGA